MLFLFYYFYFGVMVQASHLCVHGRTFAYGAMVCRSFMVDPWAISCSNQSLHIMCNYNVPYLVLFFPFLSIGIADEEVSNETSKKRKNSGVF